MSHRRKIRVFCVDSHPLYLEGLKAIMAPEPDMEIVGTASSDRDALVGYRDLTPEVTLMCLRLAGSDGVSGIVAIRREYPDARLIMLATNEGDVKIQRALAAGARGYMLKTISASELLAGIRAVYAGRRYISADIAKHLARTLGRETLSPREVDVLRVLAEGYRNRDIGIRLGISEKTVKGHIRSIFQKLDATDRTQAVSIGVRRGIIGL